MQLKTLEEKELWNEFIIYVCCKLIISSTSYSKMINLFMVNITRYSFFPTLQFICYQVSKVFRKEEKICFTKCSIHINRHTSIHIIWWSQTEIKYFCLPLTKYSFLYLRKIIIKFMLNNKISCRATWWVKWKAMKSIRIEFPWKNVWD